MASKSYIWKGPQTVIEVWQEGVTEPKLVFSGHVKSGAQVPVPLDDTHSQVKSWLAFKLLDAVPADQIAAPTEQPVAAEARRGRIKENSDG